MKLAALLVVWAMAGCAVSPSALTSAGHVVVPTSQFPGVLGMAGWSPSEEDIRGCEHALGRKLAREGHDLTDYYLRLSGVMRDGHRRIAGIAADKRVSGSGYMRPPSVKAADGHDASSGSIQPATVEEEVIVLPAFGGGEAFFSFEYNVESGKLSKFQFNAPL